MKQSQRSVLRNYLGEGCNPEQPLSKQQLISRVNVVLENAGKPPIHERDPDIDILFRRTTTELRRKLQLLGPGRVEHGHDAMMNSCWKVAFESALAAVIFRNKNFVEDEILATTNRLAAIVLPSLKANETSADKALYRCYRHDPNANHAFYARQKNPGRIAYPLEVQSKGSAIPREAMLSYYEMVLRSDNYEDTFEEKLTAIYNFGDLVTRPHKYSDEQLTPTALAFSTKERTGWLRPMIENWSYYKKSKAPGWFDQDKAGNPSVSRQTRQEINQAADGTDLEPLTLHNNKSGDYAGIWAVKGTRTIDVSNPYLGYVEDLLIPPIYDITGVGLWRPRNMTDRWSDAAGVAMHRLDMPMIGGMSGGMGSYLITMKWIGDNLTSEKIVKSFLAAYSVMISKGYHSFHEVAAVGRTLLLPYDHGDYLSVLDGVPEILELDDFRELLGRFDELLEGARRTGRRQVLRQGIPRYRPSPSARGASANARARRNTVGTWSRE